MSGKIVDVRDQVRIMERELEAFMDSMRAIRRSSTHGPFFEERLMRTPLSASWWRHSSVAALLAAATAADDVTIGLLALLAGAVADGRHAPGGLRMVAQRAGTLAAAVRMVHGVHRRAARLRAHTHVTLAAGLAHRDVLVVGVAHDTDSGAAIGADQAHLARGQTQRGHRALLGHELDAHAGGAAELGAAARLELDVVDERADRHRGQRHRVAHG